MRSQLRLRRPPSPHDPKNLARKLRVYPVPEKERVVWLKNPFCIAENAETQNSYARAGPWAPYHVGTVGWVW